MEASQRKALLVGGVALLGFGGYMLLRQSPGAPAPGPSPAPAPIPGRFPFAGTTRLPRPGDDYDNGWNSVPVLKSPGPEGDGVFNIQSNVAMRIRFNSQVFILGPAVSGPNVFGLPASGGVYYPVAGGFIRAFDLAVAPS